MQPRPTARRGALPVPRSASGSSSDSRSSRCRRGGPGAPAGDRATAAPASKPAIQLSSEQPSTTALQPSRAGDTRPHSPSIPALLRQRRSPSTRHAEPDLLDPLLAYLLPSPPTRIAANSRARRPPLSPSRPRPSRHSTDHLSPESPAPAPPSAPDPTPNTRPPSPQPMVWVCVRGRGTSEIPRRSGRFGLATRIDGRTGCRRDSGGDGFDPQVVPTSGTHGAARRSSHGPRQKKSPALPGLS